MDNTKKVSQPGDEGVIAGIRGLDQWRMAWARSVAYAWKSAENTQELISNPESVFRKFKYTLPPGLTLEVEQYQGDEEYKYKDGVNGWIHMLDDLSGKVTMILPPKPQNEAHLAMALADYDATGKTYPFTCS